MVSSHQVYQATQAPIPSPYTVRRPTIAHKQLSQLPQLKQGKRILSHSWPYHGQNDSQANLQQSPSCKEDHNNHNQQRGKTQPVLGNKITKKTYTDRAGEEITVSQPVGEREQQCRTHNRPVSTGYGHTIHQSVEEKLMHG